MKVCLKRFSAFAVALFVLLSSLVVPTYAAGISFDEGGIFGKVVSWLGGSAAFDALVGTDHSGNYVANKPQAYYTTPTESVEDKYGNVTNYYRGGDTTTTKIIDSYNHTFNTIHNTTNNTNNYSANVKLQDFLNSYTTNNNNYTYNTEYKSWYYDNTSNTYNYDASQTYYNTDNSQYYISIDNSTDEYYLVDVQYSPTFVTVNYTYNTTNNNNTTNYGDVTNVYYFELTDGRNSSTLSADEVAGLDLGCDVANYELVTDDPNTLSLQHFDGDYTDSSSYGRTFYSENRSSNYVDSGEFGKAVKLPSGSAAGVTIPGLSGYDGLTFDFRVYYDKIDSLGIYLGNTNLFQRFVESKSCYFLDFYSDVGSTFSLGRFCRTCYNSACGYPHYTSAGSKTSGLTLSKTIANEHTPPTSSYSGWNVSYSNSYGYFDDSFDIKVVSQSDQCEWGTLIQDFNSAQTITVGTTAHATFNFSIKLVNHYRDTRYTATPTNSGRSVPVDFSYSTYSNQWVPMRITISGGKIYYFVNGDLVGSGAFTMPVADKFYIKSSGTLYLDELRVTTGDMVSSGIYMPSNSPYDTNKILALPSTLTANTIYVRHSMPVSAFRVGGVRPSNPSAGFLYIPLYGDYTGGQAQLYDGANWVDVEAMVYDGSTTKSAKGYKFTPMGASSDVDKDLEPGRPSKPEEGPVRYNVANYKYVSDDPNTLSLQHFDGDYTDISSYDRTAYSENRSVNYVDSGAFGKAIKLPSGSAAGVTIPGLSDYDGLTFDFRIRYDDPSSLGIYIGDTNLFQEVVEGTRVWGPVYDLYSDQLLRVPSGEGCYLYFDKSLSLSSTGYKSINDIKKYYVSSSLDSADCQFPEKGVVVKFHSVPTSFLSGGFKGESLYSKKFGWMVFSDSVPFLYTKYSAYNYIPDIYCEEFVDYWKTAGTIHHWDEYTYHWNASQVVVADFSYSSYEDQWISMRITIDDEKLYYFVNGDLVGSGDFSLSAADKFYIKSSGTLYLDELRVTTGDLVSSESYTPFESPFDTSFALPNTLIANTIYVRHSTPVSDFRVGGDRPSDPSTGFLYIPLYDDDTGGQAQFYDGSNWVDVEATVYDGSTAKSVKGFKFIPTNSDDSGADGSCAHDWKETSRTDATCTTAGSVTYTCSKCDGTKTESLSKISHDWEVKEVVQTSYDESGNVLVEGYTIYRCSVCGEEHKDTTGSGPPTVPDEEEKEEGFLGWLGDKLGGLFGALGDGIISLLEATLGKILDSLISLVEMVFERLSKIVNLFGGFGDALGIIWSWLPEDIVVVLVAGVTIFVFFGVIKLFK